MGENSLIGLVFLRLRPCLSMLPTMSLRYVDSTAISFFVASCCTIMSSSQSWMKVTWASLCM